MRSTCHWLHETVASTPTSRPGDSHLRGHSFKIGVLGFWIYALLFMVPIVFAPAHPACAFTTTVTVLPKQHCVACPLTVMLNPGTYVLTYSSGSWGSNGAMLWMGYINVLVPSISEWHALGQFTSWYEPRYPTAAAAENAAKGSTLVLTITGISREVAFYTDHIGNCGGQCTDNLGGPIVVDIQGNEMPAFEIVSATFDKSVYWNGVDTAHLTVMVKSNWGTSSALTLVPIMISAVGDEIQLPSETFPLGPDEQHLSALSWVPDPGYSTFWDIRLELWAGGSRILSDLRNMDIATNEVDPAVTEQIQGEMVQCEAGAACGSALVSAVPYLGLLNNQYAAKSLHCITEAYRANGDSGNARVFRWYENISNVLHIAEYASLVISAANGGAASVTEELATLLPEILLAIGVCTGEYVYWAEYGNTETKQFAGTSELPRQNQNPIAQSRGAYILELADGSK